MIRGLLRTQTAPLRAAVIARPAFNLRATAALPSSVRFYSEEAKKSEEEKKSEETKEESSEEPKDELTLLKESLEASKQETSQFKDRYLRAIADFRNLQDSTKREIQKSKELALKSFARDLLEVADTFDIALKTLVKEEGATTEKKNKELDDLVEGVQLTQNMFLNTMKRHGLEQIEAMGEKFDPNVHEATFEVPQPDKEAGTVFFVQQPGYFLNKRVLRPAKVGVVKAAE
ncbi:CYFA0S01e07888g1_1 [Cyberlindnera fabianii]|uniref:GrpE protein homolog n=1 Tax=Cyberlindnera fabianii TaxID=36022 RepID=A0A061AHW6_CYBFA|nr:GrpE protein, mitochondrial [Cyberlindnera fabianii]CDR37147.1 CYFA0S01e07888g1_1 [Cyberlindnera fabianii]